MSWGSTKQGGLKGGRNEPHRGSALFQAPPSFHTLANRDKKQFLERRNQNRNLRNPYGGVRQPPPRPLHSTPSNNNTRHAASEQDCIASALNQQFELKLKAESYVDSALDLVINDVQRILSESLEFVAAKTPDNNLLLEVKKQCIDVSKIPLVNFKASGTLPLERYSKKPKMTEVRPNGGLISSSARVNGGETSHQGTANGSPVKKEQQQDCQLPEPKTVFFEERDVRLSWPKPFGIGTGLVNVGNTCFLNATIQCLAYTPALINYFSSESHRKTCKVQGFCVTCTLQELLPQLLRVNFTVRPSQMISNIRAFAKGLSIGRQEDAHEFLRFVIEAMRKSALTGQNLKTLDVYSQETTIASRIFGGFYRSRVLCQSCKQPSSVFDPFMDIPLDVGKNVEKLEDALASFTRVEHLNSPNNLYKCERCKKMCYATKQVTIHKPPNVLTFQLKRFLHSMSMSFCKIDRPVSFPEILDLKPYMSSTDVSVRYKLYGVLVHSGSSCHSGHYFSYVRTFDDSWYRMDDSSVTTASRGQVLSQKAYLLFYSRLPSAPPSNGTSLCQGAASAVGSAPKPLYGPLQNGHNNQANSKQTLFGMPQTNCLKTASQSSLLPPNGQSKLPTSCPTKPSGNGPALLNSTIQQKSPSFQPRVITHGKFSQNGLAQAGPSPQKVSALPAASKTLVPYASDDEDEQAACGDGDAREPGSSWSSNGSQGSKENRDENIPRSPKRIATAAFKQLSSSPVKDEEPERVPPASVKPCTILSSETSESVPESPPVLRESSASSLSSSHLSHCISESHGESCSSDKKTVQARFNVEELATTQSQVGDVSSNENKRKHRKKKKRNRSKRHSSPPVVSPVWIEKDASENLPLVIGNMIALEPQPEPAISTSLLKPAVTPLPSPYGTDVRSWSGGQSILAQEVDTAAWERRKRDLESSDEYDQQLDAGKQKKFKSRFSAQPAHFIGGGSSFQHVHNCRIAASSSRSKSVNTSSAEHFGTRRTEQRQSDSNRRRSP